MHGAAAVGEIEVVRRLGRIENVQNSRGSGIGDGCRRETPVPIRVVGRVGGKIGGGQFQTPLTQQIDKNSVYLKQHPLVETLPQNAGNNPA